MNSSDLHILSRICVILLIAVIPALLYFYYRSRVERKQADKLRYRLENYHTLFNRISDGVFRCDLDGQFLSINDAAARMLGFRDVAESLSGGHKFSSNFRMKEEFGKIISVTRKRGKIQNYPVEIITVQGRPVELELTGNSISDSKDGTVSGLEGIIRETGEQIEHKQYLENSTDMLVNQIDEKNREFLELEQDKIRLEKLALMGEMAAVIVHEIRNPLSSIKIGLSTIEKRAGLESRDLKCLRIAYDEVKALERILDELLDFAKPLEFNPRLCEINAIINMSIQQKELEFKQASVEIRTELAESLPPGNVDVDKLVQVLQNIYLNAVHAMPEGGSLTISSNQIRGGMVEISIADTGLGMSQKDLEKIFEPFFSRREGGTGLGMTIVKKIITAHSGCIEVKSSINNGTTVRLQIPIQTSDTDKS